MEFPQGKIFVGCMFVGMGMGMFFGAVGSGMLVGMGVGFIVEQIYSGKKE
jgi:hypothetical protein